MSTPTALVSFLAPLALKDWLGPVATATAALVAITGVIISTVIQRRTGRESVKQAQRSADAAHVSATASERSSKAAVEAVGVNRETASGVAQRAEADALAKRYQDSATQMGNASAAVRLAGLYAMARLADDWGDQRQTCINVLCAYYRTKKEADEEEWHVKNSLLELLGSRYRQETGREPGPWSECHLNLKGSSFRDADFSRMVFLGGADFSESHFDGVTRFFLSEIASRVVLQGSTISSLFTCEPTFTTDGSLDMEFAIVVKGARVVIRCSSFPDGAWVHLDGVRVEGELEVVARNQAEPAGTVMFQNAWIEDGAKVTLRSAGLADAASYTPDIVAVDWLMGAATVLLGKSMLDLNRLTWRNDEAINPEVQIISTA